MEGEGPGLGDVAEPSLVLEDGRPLHGEQVGVLGPGDQAVDPGGPLVRARVGLEGDDVGDLGQPAADVERRPAGELGVGAGVARLQAQLAELGGNERVDQVGGGAFRRSGNIRPARDQDPGDGDLAAEPGHDRGLAHPVEPEDEAGGVDRGEVGGVGLELGQAGDVGGRAVGVAGDDPELLAPLAGDGPLRWLDGERGELGILALADRHPLADPAGQRVVLGRADGELLAPAVGDLGRRLADQEARGRAGREHSPPPPVLDQRLVIRLRVEPEQAETEAVLAAGFAVTTAGVATVLGEDRHDLADEPNGPEIGEVGDLHRDIHGPPVARNLDQGDPLSDRPDQARLIDRGDLGVPADVSGRARQVARLAARPVRHQELARPVGTPDHDLARLDFEAAGRGSVDRAQADREQPSQRS